MRRPGSAERNDFIACQQQEINTLRALTEDVGERKNGKTRLLGLSAEPDEPSLPTHRSRGKEKRNSLKSVTRER